MPVRGCSENKSCINVLLGHNDGEDFPATKEFAKVCAIYMADEILQWLENSMVADSDNIKDLDSMMTQLKECGKVGVEIHHMSRHKS
ncbi:Uncharacterized protein TCM_039589 [Theobroma cacao]|uniref:Uncharacterized protein n=1 Tax=Theobroma cacao TaxID=3641 RepID=A0A061GSG0_THECC|nr:Uncharacterized protein TCM_039589 [Theobroma cacao]